MRSLPIIAHCIVAVALVALALPALAQADNPRNNPAPPDWITATNQPCKIWNPSPQPNESVTWSGPCEDGYASGEGVLHWTVNGKPDADFEGTYRHGKRNGHGVLRTPDGTRIEGAWVDDKLITGNRNAI